MRITPCVYISAIFNSLPHILNILGNKKEEKRGRLYFCTSALLFFPVDKIAGVLQGDMLAPIPLYHLSRLRT